MDLSGERFHTLKLSFRSKIADESDFEIFAIDIAFEIEKMNFEEALRFAATDCWSITEICYAVI